MKNLTALLLALLLLGVMAAPAAGEGYTLSTIWGPEGSDNGQFVLPKAIALDCNGNVYVADTFNHRIQKFDNDGTFLTTWGSEGFGDGQFNWPEGIATDHYGNVFVTDTNNNRIQKFNSTGHFITKWGSIGRDDGQFMEPWGIAVDGDGNVYVADTANHRIQKFSNNGIFITKWGSWGDGSRQFNYPSRIAVDDYGYVYVSDRENHRIQKFSNIGTFVTQWGLHGSGKGQFNRPEGIAVDGEGHVYVADSDNHRVQKFTSTGEFVATWGSSGSGGLQFRFPAGITVDSYGNVYVVDTNNHRIQKFNKTSEKLHATIPSTPITTEPTISIIVESLEEPMDPQFLEKTMDVEPHKKPVGTDLSRQYITLILISGFIFAGLILYHRKNISNDTTRIGRSIAPGQFPPELSDKYSGITLIGKGGFGRVFKATRKDGTTVAVKIPLSIDAATGKSFIAELQSWTRLSHPNIVRLYDYNIMPIPYFEMEYCDGALADVEKPLKPREAAWLIFSICEGLKVAHALRIIHRDLKPHNILMKSGVPKVSDWGLAKVMSESTTTTTTSFTTFYAAPEQFANSKKDERTDIWQIGVILYELVTGVLPFKGGSIVEIMSSITTKNPTPPGEIVADADPVEDIILKCLEKEPANRYQSVLKLQQELARYLQMNYTEELKKSVTAGNTRQASYYCGELVLTALHTGDLKSAYKYLQDLLVYAQGETKQELKSLADTMQFMVENEMEVSEDILMKADLLVHRMKVG